MDIHTQETHGDYIVTIYYDPEPLDVPSPREWDNLGTMVCQHDRYDLGDVRLGRYEEWEPPADVAVLIPLGLYDHGGITMYAGGGSHVMDGAGWDSGTVGVIYVTSADVIECYGADTPENRDKARTVLLGEVETYDQYLRGEVYGYVVEKRVPCCESCGHEPDHEHVDSCWGFFGDASDVIAEALDFVPESDRSAPASAGGVA